LRLGSELPRFTREADLLTKWKTVYPLKENTAVWSCLYSNSNMWLVVGQLPLAFSALILYVVNVACN
jgi:hypothetical protein